MATDMEQDSLRATNELMSITLRIAQGKLTSADALKISTAINNLANAIRAEEQAKCHSSHFQNGKRLHFFYISMDGSYYKPCTLIKEFDDECVICYYHDDLKQDIEKTVPKNLIKYL